MASTLTLQIPFVLLGRNEVENSRDWLAPMHLSTRPIEQIYEILCKLCPDTPFNLNLDDENPSAKKVDFGWTVRPGSATLSIDERALLGRNVWYSAVMLERRGIPVDTNTLGWKEFEKEVGDVCGMLKWGCESEKKIPDAGYEGKWWSLICPESCYLSITVVLSPPSPLPRKDDGGLGWYAMDMVRNVLMIVACGEREVSMLMTPSALLKFSPLSRFLEFSGMQAMSEAKREIWRSLKRKEGRMSERRLGMVYAREKKKWIAGLEVEDRVFEQTNGRKRGWWDAVREMDEEDVEKIVWEMEGLKGEGRRLGLEFDIDRSNVANNQTSTSTTEDNYSVQKANGAPHDQSNVTSVSFCGYRSTLEAPEIIAYTSIISHIVHSAMTLDSTTLSRKLEDFRTSTLPSSNSLLYNFQQFLNMLDISEPTRSFWVDNLTPVFSEQHSSRSQPQEKEKRPSLRQDPFSPLREHVESALSKEREYIPRYIDRYAKVDGFHPTPGWKLYALMLCEQQAGRKREYSGRREKVSQWADMLEDIRFGEAAIGFETIDMKGDERDGDVELSGSEDEEKKRVSEYVDRQVEILRGNTKHV